MTRPAASTRQCSANRLAAALESLVDRAPLPVTLRTALPDALPAVVAASGYFAVAEALTNVAKHSGARHAGVVAPTSEGRVHIFVTDDGRGGATLEHSTGLRGVADRLDAVAGTLRVHSPQARGTRIEIELPRALS